MITARDIEQDLKNLGSKDVAKQMLKFFKTGPGEYGEGDMFLGVRNPQVRLIVKKYWKTISIDEIVKLVKSPLHEVRLCGLLILVELFLKAMRNNDENQINQIFKTYIGLHQYINNWDLVDLSAIKIVGSYEMLFPEIDIMDNWIYPREHTLWQQRISMVSTWMLVRHNRQDVCFERAKILISSHYDLLHKAAGWMLREAWKKGYKEGLRQFLDENVEEMSNIMLSYATEQMDIKERHSWQERRRSKRAIIK